MTAPTPSPGGDRLYCSFCGKSRDEVQKLIAGPSVFICDECVDLMGDMLHPDRLAALEAKGDEPILPKGEDEGLREGFYVASRASVLERGRMWRLMRSLGAPIVSTWIDEDGENDTASLDELWVRIRREVVGAARLILYVEADDFPLKGAFVEVGMALAAGVPITIVAPGVVIQGRNCRPFGSWIRHPSVGFANTVEQALALTPQPGDAT